MDLSKQVISYKCPSIFLLLYSIHYNQFSIFRSMGKKKKTQTKVAGRNPEDFLNDLKFLRKNKQKKEEDQLSHSEQLSNEEEYINNEEDLKKAPKMFLGVQKLVKEKKSKMKIKGAVKKQGKEEIKRQNEANEHQQRFSF